MTILIVDDEPLTQIGIQSMISSLNKADFTVCATASNGAAALDLIEQKHPDIVITDIKMPQMNGLDLIKASQERFDTPPLFIMLTNFEEFAYAKEALNYGAIEYLIKLELTPDTLLNALKKADSKLLKEAQSSKHNQSVRMLLFRERFLFSLLHDLFISDEQFELQCRDLKLQFNAPNYLVISTQLFNERVKELAESQPALLYNNAQQMLCKILSKYLSFEHITLDLQHSCFICSIYENPSDYYKTSLFPSLKAANEMLFDYFSIHLKAGIGYIVNTPGECSLSYSSAREALLHTSSTTPLIQAADYYTKDSAHDIFNISLFRSSLTQAYEEYDSKTLQSVYLSLEELFLMHPSHYAQCMDATSNILFLSISLLSDGEKIVSEIFSNDIDGYRSLYRMTSVSQLLSWLKKLFNGLCDVFDQRKKDYKTQMIRNVEAYIDQHLTSHPSLNEVAAAFGISPNYLSALFKKLSKYGFSEYITQRKIEQAKQYMQTGNYKVYEIADLLGFENAFYFSKVFKKVEGISPKDYISLNSKFIPENKADQSPSAP